MDAFDYDIDFTTRTLTVVGDRPHDMVMPPGLFAGTDAASGIDRIAVRPSAGHAIVALPGVDAVVELRIGRLASDLLNDRNIVYLDQNHWSAISAWRTGAPVSDEIAAAAERLVALVEEERILLPASGAHLVETTPLYGERRVALAGTVLSLSRGWQMRNPFHVRIDELRAGLRGADPVANDVFTPNSDQVFTTAMREPDSSDLPGKFADLTAEMISMLGLYSAVIDSQAIPDSGGKEAAGRWAADWQRVAGLIVIDGLSREKAAEVAHARLIVDAGHELMVVSRELGLSAEDIGTAMLAKDNPIETMPYMSRLAGVLFRRMRNTSQTWEPNHLFDIHFLCCAAGYADVVIGERQTIDYLQRLRDIPPGAALAKTLPAGVALLDEIL